jgi:hypothetical protein
MTPVAPGVATPDKVETSVGTLNLRDRYPHAATVQKIYDNLDASRALQAYLSAGAPWERIGTFVAFPDK